MTDKEFPDTPGELGYRFPAEWDLHEATWLSYPHDDSYSWPGKLASIFPSYNRFIAELSKGEKVRINVRSDELLSKAKSDLIDAGADIASIQFYLHPTNDAWCRDHGPAFLVNREAYDKKVIVSWKYNAWGEKYPHDLDEKIPGLIGEKLNLPVYYPGIVMEGGAVEFNGKGTVLTTTSCLLHENRNPGLDREKIEAYLRNFYGVEQVLWLEDGINGDDTNGHIDDLTRFFRQDAVITLIETNRNDTNYKPLRENLQLLKKMRLHDGRQLDIAEIPMPEPVYFEGQRLPASYANFYISNRAVIVPEYHCRQDDRAMSILQECFPDRSIIGIDSMDIIWGLGSFHCLSQQEPQI
jgi:agmatine deiminase